MSEKIEQLLVRQNQLIEKLIEAVNDGNMKLAVIEKNSILGIMSSTWFSRLSKEAQLDIDKKIKSMNW